MDACRAAAVRLTRPKLEQMLRAMFCDEDVQDDDVQDDDMTTISTISTITTKMMMIFFISCKRHWSISWVENSVLSDFLVEFEIRTDEEIRFLWNLKFKRRRNFCLHKWEIPIFQTARDDEKTRVVKTSSLKIKDQKRLWRGHIALKHPLAETFNLLHPLAEI